MRLAFLSAALEQGLGDLGDRKHEVDRARRDGALWHTVVAGLIRVLSDDEAPFLLDGGKPQAAVAPRPRQDHADRALTAVLRQRMQQHVEGQPRAALGLWFGEVQDAQRTDKYCPGGMT